MNPRTLIIAEAGVNHNGDLELAKQLIAVAAMAGADFVKFQTFNAKRQVTSSAKKAEYQTRGTDERETQQAMLHKLELSRDMHLALMEHCAACNVGFLSTGFDIESIDLLVGLGLDMFKVPSGEITNLPYLRHIGQLRKKVIVSTGMANLGEIESAIRALEAAGTPRQQITLLHCTTEYPTPMNEVNLGAIHSLRAAFGTEVGYSDHTKGIEVSIAAVALGAKVIEKHFTLDRDLPGPDHAASLIPDELVDMVKAVRNIEIALGDGIKKLTASEAKNISVARKSIVASRPIKCGERFTSANLTTKRPGDGVSPMRWDELLTKTARRDYAIDELIDE